MTSLGERIYEERKKHGLSQGDLADKLGISTKAVSKWETGESQPTIENINRLSEIFGVTSDYLIGGKAINAANQDKHGNFQYLEDQKARRKKFRIIGWILLPIGVGCVVYGLIRFLQNFSSIQTGWDFGGIAGNAEIGMAFFITGGVFTFAGVIFLILGYAGAFARYQASELMPVKRDATNYLLDGTREETGKTVKTILDSVGRSVNGGEGITCPKCGTLNEKGAAFCDQCGVPLTKKCPYCGENNDADAKHCRHCGASFS